MSRTAKKSDLVKSDLVGFSIGLTEAKALKITKEDLRGIKEIIPNQKYKIRATTGNRVSETFNGNLLQAIKRKKELNNLSVKKAEQNLENINDLMFMEAVDLYIDYLFEREQRNDIDLNTIYDHIRKINTYISEYFAKYKLIEVNTKVVEKFITTMRNKTNQNNPEKKLSEQTIGNYLRTLNAIFNFLVTKEIIDKNPVNNVTNKPKPKKSKPELNYFRIEDAKYALQCLDRFADIRLKTFMNIIFSLGCRREEVCGLRWKDIDFNNKEVNFNYAITTFATKNFLNKYKGEDSNRIRTKGLKTDNSYRTNFLSEIAVNQLRNYYQFKIACGIEVQPDDFIFTTYQAGRNTTIKNREAFDDKTPADPNKLSEHWRRFKKEYNIKDVDLHRIRHTVANVLERKGVPKKDIAKMLGNTERVLEEFYTHVDVDELKKLRNTIDNELFSNIEYVNLDIELVAKII